MIRRHGTLTAYIKDRCRCELCGAAGKAYRVKRARRQKLKNAQNKTEPEASIPQASQHSWRTHGTMARYERGCRCEACTTASHLYRKHEMDSKKKSGDYLRIKHGSQAMLAIGCLCTACIAWKNQQVEYKRKWRAKRRDPSTLVHGRASTYNEFGCRCELCKEASRRSYLRRRRRSGQPQEFVATGTTFKTAPQAAPPPSLFGRVLNFLGISKV